MINKESLVIATNLPILDETIINRPSVIKEDGDITITSSYAIFYKDGNSETPASVVGFQYSYLQFYERFVELTADHEGDKVLESKLSVGNSLKKSREAELK